MEQDDKAALKIAHKAVDDLAELVIASWRKTGMADGELAFFGSIFQYYDCIREGLIQRLNETLPGVNLIEAHHPAAHGAAMLAMQLFGGT